VTNRLSCAAVAISLQVVL